VSLFHDGKELFDKFALSIESEITFTDYCSELIFPYQHDIRFTSKSLIFTYPKEGFHNIHDDWIELDSLEFHPWYNVLSFQNVKGVEVTHEYDQIAIANWLSGISDPPITFPYVDVRKGHIAFVVNGKPRSIRSEGGKRSFKDKVEQKAEEIRAVYPTPFRGHVEMRVDVFSSDPNSNDRPDVDRLSGLITDAFQGIAYADDKQIRDLKPRIIDVSQAFTQLECRTHPMGCFELTNIPLGSVYPLALGETEYYVVRIIYYR
jgi:Holliday junction resolvase RusA-like endonuclease